MTDEPLASDLAREGLDLWTAGDLEAAETKYRQAVQRISEGRWAVPHVRGQLAAVLAALGRDHEARVQFEVTLREELSLADGEVNHPAVRVARYFLGQHLLRTGDPEAALTAVEPMLGQPGDFLLRIVEAEAQRALGRLGKSLAALRLAFESAKTDEQREDNRARITEIQGSRDISDAG